MEDVELEPIDLSLPVMHELDAKYIADNPDLVNRFVLAGISEVLKMNMILPVIVKALKNYQYQTKKHCLIMMKSRQKML